MILGLPLRHDFRVPPKPFMLKSDFYQWHSGRPRKLFFWFCFCHENANIPKKAHEGSVPAFFQEGGEETLADFGLEKDYCMKSKRQGCCGLDESAGVLC